MPDHAPNLIREAREGADMTISALAVAADVSRQTVYRLESGDPGRHPARVVLRVCDALGLELRDVVEESDE